MYRIRKNPFEKHLRTEDHFQYKVATWMKYQHPHVPWVHTPNEGRRSPFEQYLFKLFGSISGVSDVLIFRSAPNYHGLALELKVIYPNGNKNYPTKSQKKFLRTLHDEGWCTGVAWTFEEATKIIDDYLYGKEPEISYKY